MKSVAALQEQFAVDAVTFSEAAPNYPLITVSNQCATATIALHGAHVTAYQARGETPAIWTSASAIYKEGKAIRGGIPLCWPWFGDHRDKSLPAHGFARNRFWTLLSVEEHDQATVLTLGLKDEAQTRALWPHAFSLELKIIVGASLTLQLTSNNTGTKAFELTHALHSYIAIGDIKNTKLSGLDGAQYIDKVDRDRASTQVGDIVIDKEFDRIYQNTATPVCVYDQENNRQIIVKKSGSNTTVVWNPWIEKSEKMADFEASGFRRMVCVEAANAEDSVIQLSPGETHTLETRIKVEFR